MVYKFKGFKCVRLSAHVSVEHIVSEKSERKLPLYTTALYNIIHNILSRYFGSNKFTEIKNLIKSCINVSEGVNVTTYFHIKISRTPNR